MINEEVKVEKSTEMMVFSDERERGREGGGVVECLE